MATRKWSSKSTNRVKHWKAIVEGEIDCVGVTIRYRIRRGIFSGVQFTMSPLEAEALIAGLQRYVDGREIELSQQEKE